MTLLADESIERQIVERLWLDGHEVLYVAEMEPGIEDAVVLERANESLALLLTGDKDFGELVYQDKLLTAGGVILVRLAGLLAETKAEIVSAAIREHEAEFAQSFSVISPGRVRRRTTVEVPAMARRVIPRTGFTPGKPYLRERSREPVNTRVREFLRMELTVKEYVLTASD